ncbi:ras-like protein family member 11A-like isoform X2 [Stigmatopora nigra]
MEPRWWTVIRPTSSGLAVDGSKSTLFQTGYTFWSALFSNGWFPSPTPPTPRDPGISEARACGDDGVRNSAAPFCGSHEQRRLRQLSAGAHPGVPAAGRRGQQDGEDRRVGSQQRRQNGSHRQVSHQTLHRRLRGQHWRALLPKGHPGWRRGVAPDPGHALRGSSGRRRGTQLPGTDQQVHLLGRRLRAGFLHRRPAQLPHRPTAVSTRQTHPPVRKHSRRTGNKSDLLRARQVPADEGAHLASSLGGAYFEASARENHQSVRAAFLQLCHEVSRALGGANGEKRRGGLHLARPKSPNMQELKRRFRQVLSSKVKSAGAL